MQGSKNAGGVPRNNPRIHLLVCLTLLWVLAFGYIGLARAREAPANSSPTDTQRSSLRLNLPEGFTWTSRLATETWCTTDVNPDEQLKSRRERVITFGCRVKEKHADGNVSIEFQYRRIRDVDYGPIGYPDSSEIDDAKVEDNPQGNSYQKRALRALCGRTFVAEIAPTGQVRRIEGFPRLYDDLHRALAFRWPEAGNIKVGKDFLKEMEDRCENDFQKFFGGYWPLSEDRLKETVQQLFLIWPEQAIDRYGSWHTEDVLPALALRRDNLWTFRPTRKEAALLDLISRVRMDLDLCEPNIPKARCEDCGADFLAAACYRLQKFKERDSCAGQRTGLFYVDMKTGLIQDATWSEELTGAIILRDPERGRPEPQACPSKRTTLVSVMTFKGN
jgi:hypothetical protein